MTRTALVVPDATAAFLVLLPVRDEAISAWSTAVNALPVASSPGCSRYQDSTPSATCTLPAEL